MLRKLFFFLFLVQKVFDLKIKKYLSFFFLQLPFLFLSYLEPSPRNFPLGVLIGLPQLLVVVRKEEERKERGENLCVNCCDTNHSINGIFGVVLKKGGRREERGQRREERGQRRENLLKGQWYIFVGKV